MILVACIHNRSTGIHYPGLRHSDIVKEIVSDLREFPTNLAWGFIDEEGEFKTREEAVAVAVRAGQYGMGQEPTGNTKRLHSEDIY